VSEDGRGVTATGLEEAVLQADSIGRFFGARQVLKAATLWARRGEVTALLGRNGSGKTTLLRIAVGRLASHHGVVRYRGRASVRPRLHRLARRGLFYLPQHGVLPRGRTVREAAESILRAREDASFDALPSTGPRTLSAWAERWGLQDLLEATHGELSGGEKNRAGVALAVLRGPVCLLTDEPLTGSAPHDRARVVEALRLLRDDGCAVVVTGHEARELLDLADRVVWMVAGTTRDLGRPAEALASHQFRREYLGPGFSIGSTPEDAPVMTAPEGRRTTGGAA
jgi:ABC-type multidrug transport system ATPase subunit